MSKLVFRLHVIQRMFERNISVEDIRHVVDTGEIIKDYADDRPFPSRLILGKRENRPIHVVAADDTETKETIIITAYEPDPDIWDSDFRRKKE